MRLRTKLFVGLITLFGVISLLAVVGGYAVYQLDKSSEEILSDNFTSIDYTVQMLNALDETREAQQTMLYNPDYSLQTTKKYKEAKDNFNNNFELQASNITEQNEAKLVAKLRQKYATYISNFEIAQGKNNLSIKTYKNEVEPVYQEAKNQILLIYKLNKNTVLLRSAHTQEFADNNSIFIITLGLFSVGLTFVFILYFPIYITKPLVRLKEKLQAVANYDYSQQFLTKSEDEIGLLASSFNTMVSRLKEHQKSSVAKLMHKNQHTQAVMNQLQEGVLVLDENLKVTAINNLLAHLMKVGQPKSWIGKYAPDMALKSNLMRKLIGPTLKPYLIDENDSNEKNELIQEKEEHSRILRIKDQEQEYVYQVTQQKFYTTNNTHKQFAGYIITVKEVNNKQPQISQMQANSFLNQLESNLVKLKQQQEKQKNQETLQYINQLIDTTQKFNTTLNGRLNITH